MKTFAANVFGDDKFYRADVNYRKRPDLICMPDSTIGITGIEDVPDEIGLVKVRKLLLIELKKGAFEIKRKERDQAVGYLEEIVSSTVLGGSCYVTGFVVGDSIADSIGNSVDVKFKDVKAGTLFVTTYSQLVDTAERRMFGLRKVLADRYDDVPGMELYNQVRLSL